MKDKLTALGLTFCIMSALVQVGVAQEKNYPRPELLMEPSELAKLDVAKKYIVLDARNHAKFKQGHVPSAVWVNHDDWAKAFGHGKDAEGWSKRIGALGLTSSSKVVVYDDNYTKDAARIWWILRYWGVEDVRLLNGGWVAWKAGNHPTDKDEIAPRPAKFEAKARPDRLATKEQLLDSLKGSKLQIVDARSEKEFCGVEKLTNKRAGAIPGAKQLEWIDLLDKDTQRFKSAVSLRKMFEDAGIALDRPTATHCQSGGRAAVMVFGMELMGAKSVSNYYPSWAEWNHDQDTPVVPGKAKQKNDQPPTETTAGWKKYTKNPVLGGDLGTCFDISVLKEGDTYRMWFSWRPKKSIALVESKDGIQWSKPVIVLGPNDKTDWENDLNRPVVIKNGDRYQMWYTGQARGKSWIGFASSKDGKAWERMSDKPVLSAEKPWEKVAVMCPHVIYDDKAKLYRMWYSGGEQHEPDAIGFATSEDGLKWIKHEKNPIFKPDPKNSWEKNRVTGCQVIRQGYWYLMFYIGFRDVNYAQIGIARSKDGITDWQRHRANPIIRPGKDQWDHDAVYKPYAIYDGKQWLLWYNGRRGGVEQIGLAVHQGEDLGF